MGERKAAIISLLFSLFLLVSMSGVAFASSGTWVEVARFTGINEDKATDSFTCDYPEWRIRWEFVPTYHSMIFHGVFIFSITTYPIEEMIVAPHLAEQVDEVVVKVGDKSSYTASDGIAYGTSYVQDQGEFYIVIETESSFVNGYTIIVEQNIDSIPEFPSWIILPLFLTATLIAIIIKNRTFHQRS